MMRTETNSSISRDLGQGLTARWSTAADSENIAQLVGVVFREKAEDPIDTRLANTVRRLMRGDSPLMSPNDYAVVEDTSQKDGNPIVACVCLLRHIWEYEGIAFKIGRPEIVATDPAYRHRGLIRVLFDMVHERSANEGHLVTAITGIHYFYRQFGYEYALDLGGRRTLYTAQIPKAKEGAQELYMLREATVEDIPLIQQAYNLRRGNSIVWAQVPTAIWKDEIEGWKIQPEWGKTSIILIIIDNLGKGCGYLLIAPRRSSRELMVWNVGIVSGVNVQAMLPSVLRALQVYGNQIPTKKPDTDPFSEIGFLLGRNSPFYDALGDLAVATEAPYAWYVRVADLPAFIKLIGPALEKRLAASDAVGYTGEIKLDFYRGGLRIIFEQGQLMEVENWPIPAFDSSAGAGFPALVFLQVIFGYRSLEELRYAFPDIWVNAETGYLLRILFPARASSVLQL